MKNPLSDMTAPEIAITLGGLGVLGYIGYRIWYENWSSTAQGAEAWAISGGQSSPTGMGQFTNQWDTGYTGPAAGGVHDWGHSASDYGPATSTDETANLCGGSSGLEVPQGGTSSAPYCWADQGNTSTVVAGDLVAIMAKPSDGGDAIPIYAYVYGSTDSSGNIVGVDESNNVRVYFHGQNPELGVHVFPLSYLVTGLSLVGAAVGV